MIIALVLGAVLSQAPVLNPDHVRILWDYSDDELGAAQVTRFELQIDDGAWKDVGLPVATTPDSGTSPGYKLYSVPIPPLIPGEHAITVRACGAVCGPSANIWSFRLVVVPAKVGNLRSGG